MSSVRSFVPCSSVRPKPSSSAFTQRPMTSRSVTSSGYAAPMTSMTTSTKRGMKPGSMPMWCPCWIARRMTRRRMYPRSSLDGTTPSAMRNVIAREWSARMRSARSSGSACGDSSRPSVMSGANWSVSKIVSAPCWMSAIRLSPSPVSMFWFGSGVRVPTGSWLNCMNTRFQYSRKRSFSPPGRSSGVPYSTPRSRYSSEHGPHGPVGPACQKFSERGQSTMRSRGTPTASHASIASSSGPRPSSRSPSNTVIQMSPALKPKPSSDSCHACSTAPSLK